MPAITGAEIARLRANLEKSGHLGRARESFEATSIKKARVRTARPAPAAPQKSFFTNVKESFKRGDFTESLTKVLSTLSSEPYVRQQMTNRDVYVNYLYSRYKKTDDPAQKQSILNTIQNANASKSEEERFLTGMTNKQIAGLAFGTGVEIAGAIPLGGAAMRGGAGIIKSALGLGAVGATEQALAGVGKGESREAVVSRAKTGFAGGAVFGAGASVLGRIASRVFKAKAAAGEAISAARKAATTRKAPVAKVQPISHADFLKETTPRKLTFKSTQRGGGVKIPINVTKTAKLLSPEIDSILKLRKGLDPDNVFTGTVLEEMMAAVDSGAGKRIITEGGDTLAKQSGFRATPWVPDELRSSKLYNQVVDDVTGGNIPKAGSKRGDLYEVVQNEINKRLEIDEAFDLSKVKTFKPGTKTLRDGRKITIDKEGNVTTVRTVGKIAGKDAESIGLVTKKQVSEKTQAKVTELKQVGIKGEYTVGTIKTNKIKKDVMFADPVDIDYKAVARKKAAFRRGAEPEALVFERRGDDLRLTDGRHTLLAARQVGEKELPAIVIDRPVKAGAPEIKKAPAPATRKTGKSIRVLKDTLANIEANKLNKKQKILYSQERGKRFAKSEALGREVTGEASFAARKSALPGELPKIEITPLRNKLKKADVNNLFQEINKNKFLTPGEKVSAMDGLKRLLEGSLPQPNQQNLLGEIFGSDLVDLLAKNRDELSKAITKIVDVSNIPRTIMSSIDVSATLRQGAIMAAYKPKLWAKAAASQFKYLFSEKAYQGLIKSIKERPNYGLMRESGLSFTDLGADLSKREEAFKSSLAEQIPGIGRFIRASGRAYTGFMNKLRADAFDELVGAMNADGILAKNPGELDSIANFINNATGRGSIGKLEGTAGDLLNGAFFSPRLQISRINMIGLNPKFYMDLEPFARKEALKSMVRFVAAGSTVLTLAKLGGAEVGTDPRSADFGKIKIGNTRYDIWAGYQQYPRLIAQIATQTVISSTTGKPITLGEGYKPLTVTGILGRAIEMKAAPIPSFMISMLRGTTSIGDDFEWDVETANRMMPMIAGDFYDLYKERGAAGLAMALPAVAGVGVQTYGEKEFELTRDEKGKATIKRENISGLSEDLVDWVKQTPPNEANQHLDTYQEVQDLVAQGKQAEAAKITGSMSKEDYGIYKKIRKEFQKDVKVQIKDQVQAKLDRIVALRAQGERIEADKITNKMTKTEFSLYKELKREQDIEF